MKLGRARPLEKLAWDRPCRAAIFLSYTFDPIFFENEVLASILHLGSDPDEQPARYHDEAVRALQEAPVACLVDESVRRPGRRLPYDLRGVRVRTFHPKVALLVFDDFARVQVGSGNLTRSGYGENTELAFAGDLRFDEPTDVALLGEVRDLIEAADRLAGPGGTQLGAANDALQRRIKVRPERDPELRSLRFLHTETGGPLLSQFLALLPDDSKVTRIGALAPFLEKDDADWATDGAATSVLRELAGRLGKGAALDLGVIWERNSVFPAPDRAPPFEQALETLWAKRDEDDSVTYLTPTRVTTNQLRYTDAGGDTRTMPLEEAEALRNGGRMWPAGEVEVHAPERIIREIAATVPLHLWLHPATRVQDGRRVSRPLHAKLLLVATRRRGRDQTFALLGSPNLSRRALLHGPADGGNVEAALAFAVDGHVTLRDVVPELVHHAPERTTLRERTFPEGTPGFGRLIESAVYLAERRVLTVRWAVPTGEPPRPWALLYVGEERIAQADWPRDPTALTVIPDLALSHTTCELVLRAGGLDSHVPILVEDLHALPTGPGALGLDLRDLLALLGRRIVAERLLGLRTTSAMGLADAVLDGILGEGFGPTDVFRAWWGLASDLEDADLSLSGFRRTLSGALGARAVWNRLRDATHDEALGRDEAWFFGAELRRTLTAVKVPDGPDRKAKRDLLRDFLAQFAVEVDAFEPPADGRGWVTELVTFYGDRP